VEDSARSIPELLTRLIGLQVAQGRSIAEIASDIGYQKPTLLEMFMDGRAKVPLDKAYVLARVLSMSPAAFFRQVLRQYWPGDDASLDSVLGEPVTKEELEILHIIRNLRTDWEGGGT
jgi:hypothetical protein